MVGSTHEPFTSVTPPLEDVTAYPAQLVLSLAALLILGASGGGEIDRTEDPRVIGRANADNVNRSIARTDNVATSERDFMFGF